MPLQETLKHSQGCLAQSPVFAPFPCVLVCQSFVCALRVQSQYLPVLWIPITKSHWPSESDSLGIPSPFAISLRMGSLRLDINSSQQCEKFFGSIVFHLWFTLSVGMGFDFVIIVPLLPPHWGFSFVLGLEASFLVGSNILKLMAVQ